MSEFDIAIIGGGIVGLATAVALVQRYRIVVLEKELELASHQTGHNSGVVHSGLYYRPGSAKARFCTAGRRLLESFCSERALPYERCGKLVIAVEEREREPLDELERRGKANGLTGLERLDAEGIRQREPYAAGIDGLWIPQTGIVDYVEVARALAYKTVEAGGDLRLGFEVSDLHQKSSGWSLRSASGERLETRAFVACAGLHSDRIARLGGLTLDIRILPFRGEYFTLAPERRHLVKNLIYPVPDPRLPFLGVHLTRRVDGGVEAGPNAVLAARREGYRWRDVALRDLAEIFSWPGFWHLARRYPRTGLDETLRSLSRRRFARSLARLVPEITPRDLRPAGSGVRAQAITRDGRLLDDFHILEAERAVHVLNAPSPAATASLAIGEAVAERIVRQLGDASGD